MKNNSAPCDPSIHNITNFLASSVHDMKNSVNMLIYSLEKVLASVEATQLSAHTELMQVSHEAKRINNHLCQSALKIVHLTASNNIQIFCKVILF